MRLSQVVKPRTDVSFVRFLSVFVPFVGPKRIVARCTFALLLVGAASFLNCNSVPVSVTTESSTPAPCIGEGCDQAGSTSGTNRVGGFLPVSFNHPDGGAIAACSNGAICDGVCTDTTSNSANCGSCGHACDVGSLCVKSTCVSDCEAAGFTMCGADCRDVSDDSRNCGACGNACPGNNVCTGGECVCNCGSNEHCDAVTGACAANATPVDREQTQLVTSSGQTYKITLNGALDGVNSRGPIGYTAVLPVFEPNRYVRMQNVGAVPIVNPWLRVQGRIDWRNPSSIAAGAIDSSMTDRQKAYALWAQHIASRFHATTWDSDNDSVVKLYNLYGYGICGDSSYVLGSLFTTAGLAQVRYPLLQGHVIPEVWFDNRWNLLDGDEEGLVLLRDNHTLAANADLVRDHDLSKRSHSYGVLQATSSFLDQFSASVFYSSTYNTQAQIYGTKALNDTMGMTLRPGESMEWSWAPATKYHGQEALSDWGPSASGLLANGMWTYAVDFTSSTWNYAALSTTNVTTDQNGLHATQSTGQVVIQMVSPYVLVGGTVTLAGAGQVYLSWNNKNWMPVSVSATTGVGSLDSFFPPTANATYTYYLRVVVNGQAPLSSVTIANNVQISRTAAPGVQLGDNVMIYEDQTTGDHSMQITHGWTESYANQPPNAVTTAVYPTNGSLIGGTNIALYWKPATDNDGDGIVDYEFLLSDDPAARWPLSSNFHRLVSLTADAGTTHYTLPSIGLLNSRTPYYWKVRARDARGAWGAWSPIFTFQTITPHPPENVQLVVDATNRAATLVWTPSATGTQPYLYRIYGSDEKGFTISDSSYSVYVGDQGAASTEKSPFAGNFVAETHSTSFPVVGAALTGNNVNHTYYRVVAVDIGGLVSGPSDYAEMPRPFLFTQPTTSASVGQPYAYQAKTIASIGDLRATTLGADDYATNFWDIEYPIFALAGAPNGLTINPATGLVSGVPTVSGSYDVTLVVTTPQLGNAQDTQTFTINVSP